MLLLQVEQWRAHIAIAHRIHHRGSRGTQTSRSGHGELDIDLESNRQMNINISQSLVQTIVSDVLLRQKRQKRATLKERKVIFDKLALFEQLSHAAR